MDKFNKVRFLLPIEEIESSALEQIAAINALDFVEAMAIMPDVHTGYDMPIGGVALTNGVISPAWVGYDIGCGVLFQDTGIPLDRFDAVIDRQKFMDRLYQVVPVGTNRFSRGPGDFRSALGSKVLDEEAQANQHSQLGTLGGGNHFLEIGVTRGRTVGITIHSGSRNLGHRICTHYLKHAKWFDANSDLGRAYQEDMKFALAWAISNRLAMKQATMDALAEHGCTTHMVWPPEISYINVNHNHAKVLPNGRVIHRKGATPARSGQLGVIPGNMRDGVYVVRGLGNEEFLSSCSHGAGRAMGRKEAKRRLTLKDFQQTMGQAGVLAKVSENTLDEAPGAYKDIETVMNRQDGVVVEVVDFVRPLINIKG